MRRFCCFSGEVSLREPGLCVEVSTLSGTVISNTFTDASGRFRMVMMPEQQRRPLLELLASIQAACAGASSPSR